MISPAFFMASIVGFHVEFSQSMYSAKCPYSTCMSSTSVTGPSVYWRSFWASASRVSAHWARASSESAEAARQMDKIIVLVIFSSPVVISLVEISLVEACRRLAQAHLTRPGLTDIDRCPVQNLGTARLPNLDRMRHIDFRKKMYSLIF